MYFYCCYRLFPIVRSFLEILNILVCQLAKLLDRERLSQNLSLGLPRGIFSKIPDPKSETFYEKII